MSYQTPIKIGFLGFYNKLTDHRFNHLTVALSRKFNLDLCVANSSEHLDPVPEILFISTFDNSGLIQQYQFQPNEHTVREETPTYLDPRYARCTKVFTTDENMRTPWHECDYSITSDYLADPRHLRLPIYVNLTLHHLAAHSANISRMGLTLPNHGLRKDPDQNWENVLARKTKFCNFVFSNPRPQERIKFFKLLSKYKRVDSGGSVLGNLENTVPKDAGINAGSHSINKIAFIQDYKFTIAFENASHPGYVTEKIAEPMIMNSIPIYWGCPRIEEEFNPRSFVNANGRKFEDVVDQIVELDRNDNMYIDMLRQPWFADNQPNQYCSPDYLHGFFAKIVASHRART